MATTVLRLIFEDAVGSRLTLTIPNPKSDLTQASISTAMNGIIATNALAGSNGLVIAPLAAEVVSTTVTQYNIA